MRYDEYCCLSIERVIQEIKTQIPPDLTPEVVLPPAAKVVQTVVAPDAKGRHHWSLGLREIREIERKQLDVVFVDYITNFPKNGWGF